MSPDGGEGLGYEGGKKLLILDINGLLLDRLYPGEASPGLREPDSVFGKYLVYRRPFCEAFVKYCLESFVVAVWSSARRHNLEPMIDYVFGEAKKQLAFVWDQGRCTDTKLRFPGVNRKPVFLKELEKVWAAGRDGSMPWPSGWFGPHNTLLLDDSPYKALGNPPFTAVFPPSWAAADANDQQLVPGGAIRQFLASLQLAPNVQTFVKEHPFGLPPLTIVPAGEEVNLQGPKLAAAALFARVRKIMQLDLENGGDAEEEGAAPLPPSAAVLLPLVPKMGKKAKKAAAADAVQLGAHHGAPAGGQHRGPLEGVVPEYPDWDGAALREDRHGGTIGNRDWPSALVGAATRFQEAEGRAPILNRLPPHGGAGGAPSGVQPDRRHWTVPNGAGSMQERGDAQGGALPLAARDGGAGHRGRSEQNGFDQHAGRGRSTTRGSWNSSGAVRVPKDAGNDGHWNMERQGRPPPWPVAPRSGPPWREPHPPPEAMPPIHSNVWAAAGPEAVQVADPGGWGHHGAPPFVPEWAARGGHGGSGGEGLGQRWEGGAYPYEVQAQGSLERWRSEYPPYPPPASLELNGYHPMGPALGPIGPLEPFGVQQQYEYQEPDWRGRGAVAQHNWQQPWIGDRGAR